MSAPLRPPAPSMKTGHNVFQERISPMFTNMQLGMILERVWGIVMVNAHFKCNKWIMHNLVPPTHIKQVSKTVQWSIYGVLLNKVTRQLFVILDVAFGLRPPVALESVPKVYVQKVLSELPAITRFMEAAQGDKALEAQPLSIIQEDVLCTLDNIPPPSEEETLKWLEKACICFNRGEGQWRCTCGFCTKDSRKDWEDWFTTNVRDRPYLPFFREKIRLYQISSESMDAEHVPLEEQMRMMEKVRTQYKKDRDAVCRGDMSHRSKLGTPEGFQAIAKEVDAEMKAAKLKSTASAGACAGAGAGAGAGVGKE